MAARSGGTRSTHTSIGKPSSVEARFQPMGSWREFHRRRAARWRGVHLEPGPSRAQWSSGCAEPWPAKRWPFTALSCGAAGRYDLARSLPHRQDTCAGDGRRSRQRPYRRDRGVCRRRRRQRTPRAILPVLRVATVRLVWAKIAHGSLLSGETPMRWLGDPSAPPLRGRPGTSKRAWSSRSTPSDPPMPTRPLPCYLDRFLSRNARVLPPVPPSRHGSKTIGHEPEAVGNRLLIAL
jgi:hypothetical protein